MPCQVYSVVDGLMGGMNFYLRGSGRTTQDVDLAVGRSNSLSAVLDLLNNERSVIRPGSRMLWASGVARIFVRVRNQLVQLDLKSQGAEGHGMPSDLAAATELIALGRDGVAISFLAVGPLVKAKFQSYGRGFAGDYTDLHFIIKDRTYAAQVRQIADRINYEKRRDFVSEVVQRNREDEEIVRWALKIERTPSPEPRPSTNGGRGGGGHTSRNSRDSRESRDSRDSRESTSRTYNDRERRSTTTTTPSSRNPASTRASDTLVSGMQRMRVSVDPSRSRVETRPAVSRVSRQPATEVRRSRRSDREPEYY